MEKGGGKKKEGEGDEEKKKRKEKRMMDSLHSGLSGPSHLKGDFLKF